MGYIRAMGRVGRPQLMSFILRRSSRRPGGLFHFEFRVIHISRLGASPSFCVVTVASAKTANPRVAPWSQPRFSIGAIEPQLICPPFQNGRSTCRFHQTSIRAPETTSRVETVKKPDAREVVAVAEGSNKRRETRRAIGLTVPAPPHSP